ncbi:MAG: tetratricopeptide repeat protein [Cellvibrio sp.]|nr:tetratricopeptide repeat protein [Cellvibrio sp.]
MIKFIKIWPVLLVLLVSCGDNQENIGNRANQYLKSAEQLSNQGQLRAALIQAKNAIQLIPGSPQGYSQIARIYNQIGYYSEVEKLLVDKVQQYPELNYELGFSYYQRKKFRSALAALSQLSGESHQRVHLLKALVFVQLEQKVDFDLEVQKIAAISDSDGYWLLAQAKAAQAKGLWKEAESLLSNVKSNSDVYIDSLISLAEINIQLRQIEQAEKQLTTALSSSVNADSLTVEKAKILTMLVEMLVQQGRSGEAYAYQKLMANANPELDSMRSRFDEAVALYAKGNVEEAKTHLNDLHQSYPKNSNVTSLLGVIAFQQGRDDEAEAYLAQVIDPETATAGLIQTSSLLKVRNNKVDDAIELLKKSVIAQPKNAQLLATYGLALLQKDPVDKEGALALEKSIAMDAKQQRLRLALAERHYRLEEKEQALAQLETAFKYDPLDRVTTQAYLYQFSKVAGAKSVSLKLQQLKQQYTNRFQIKLIESWWLIEQGQYAEVESLLKTQPDTSTKEKLDAFELLVTLYFRQDKKEKAQSLLGEMLRLSPANTQYYLTWFNLLSEQDSARAIGFLNELLQLNEVLWQPHYYLALLEQKSQQWDQADKSLNQVLQKTSQENVRQQVVKLYNARGFHLFRSGEFQQAQVAFMKSLGVDSEDRTALYYSVQILLKQNQTDQAKAVLAAVDQNKKLAIHWFLSGLINEKEQKIKDALRDFNEAWKLDAFDLYAEKLYSVYQSQKDQSSLVNLINEWHQRLPNSSQALLLMAMLQQEKGQTNEAIDAYEKVLRAQPDNQIAMNNLAWLYIDGHPEKAEKLASVVFARAPDAVDIIDTYGWILFKNGKVKEALPLLEKASRLSPDNALIKEHLLHVQQAVGSN